MRGATSYMASNCSNKDMFGGSGMVLASESGAIHGCRDLGQGG